MAKKEKLNLDAVNLDDDLDFEDFDFGDMDGMFSPESKKKDRTPVTEVYRGTISGVKDKLDNPSYLTELLKGALPRQYGEVISTADEIRTDAVSLYDEAIREIRPQLARVATKVDKLVPAEQKLLKKITSKFKSAMGDDESSRTYKGATKAQIEDESTAGLIASVFEGQAQLEAQHKARENVERKIDRHTEHKRFTIEHKLLSSISESVSRLEIYNDKVNQAYQRKSLEIQYRHYFKQTELLETTTKFFNIFEKQHESIVRNTALPEFVKIKNSEKFKEIAKGKFFESVYGGIFNNDYVRTVKENLKKQALETIKGVKSGLQQALSGGEMMEGMGDLMPSKYHMAGEQGAAWLMDLIPGKLSQHSRKLMPEGGRIDEAGYKALNALRNAEGLVDKARSSDFLQEHTGEMSLKGGAANIAQFILDALKVGPAATKFSSGEGALEDPSIFDNRTQKSINEIIPGYLARILREIRVLRTGDESSSLVVFDYQKNAFSTRDQLTSDIRRQITEKTERSNLKEATERTTSKFLKGQTVSEVDTKEVQKFLTDISRSKMIHSPEEITKSDIYRNLNPNIRSIVDKAFESRITGTAAPEKAKFHFGEGIRGMRAATPDLRRDIEKWAAQGPEYVKALKDMGLISESIPGEYEINMDKYMELVDQTVVTSDENVKDHVSKFHPKRALDAIRNTGVFNWMYKKGKGDQEPHVGPMAQDVNAELGDKAAPGGKKIDLTTMNGVNMAAIQELDKRTSGSTTEQLEVLKAIKADTAKILRSMRLGMRAMRGMNFGMPDIDFSKIDFSKLNIDPEMLDKLKGKASKFNVDTSSFGALLMSTLKVGVDLTKETTSNFFSRVMEKLRDVKNKDYSKYTDPIAEKAKDGRSNLSKALHTLFEKASEASIKLMDVTRDVIFNKLPAGYREAAVLGSAIYKKVMDVVDAPVDIYVKGRMEAPALRATLIRIGYYIDQTTGKVIETIADIKGTVVDREGNVVLSVDDIAIGLVDVKGDEILTRLGKLVKFGIESYHRSMGRMSMLAGKAKDLVKNLSGKAKEKFGVAKKNISSIELPQMSGIGIPTLEVWGHKSYDVLVEIRDLLRERLGGGTETGKLAKIKERISKAKTDKEELRHKLKPSSTKSIADTEEHDRKTSTPHTEDDRSKDPQTDKAAWNDKDKSGRRDGDAAEILEAKAKGKEEAREKARHPDIDLTPKYKGENIFDNFFGKLTDMFGFLKNGISSIFGGIGKLFGKFGNLPNILSKVPGLSGLAGTAGEAVAGASAASAVGKSGFVRGIGEKIIDVGKSAKNMLVKDKVGKKLLQVASRAGKLRYAFLVGGALTDGLLGGALSAVGLVMSVLPAIFSSPVVLGAAALAAVGYGAYKAYKYFTRDSINDLEEIRIRQYGLTNTDKDKHHIHELLNLEEYLLDGRVGYRQGAAHLLDNRIDPKEILAVFGVDVEDTERVSIFTRWFHERFKPFFLTHLTALYAVDDKLALKDIKKLPNQKLLTYLDKISFESGPYGIASSPFKDLDTVSTDRDSVINLIDKVRSTYKKQDSGKNANAIPKVEKPDAVKAKEEEYAKSKLVPDKKLDVTSYTGKTPTSPMVSKGMDAGTGPTTEYKPLSSMTGAAVATSPMLPGAQPTLSQMASRNQGTQGEDGLPPTGQSGGSTNTAISPTDNNAPPKPTGTTSIPTAGGEVKDGQGGDRFIKIGHGAVDMKGLNPQVLKNFRAMAQEYGEKTGKSVQVNSAYRSAAYQAKLLAKNGGTGSVAKPGRSLHQFGLALDVNASDLNALEKLGLMRKYGFTRPVSGEDWHTEPAGIQNQLDEARANPMLASQLTAASLYKGGGGLGILKGYPKYHRDAKYAMRLWGASGPVVADKDSPATSATIASTTVTPPTEGAKGKDVVAGITSQKDTSLAGGTGYAGSTSGDQVPTSPSITSESKGTVAGTVRSNQGMQGEDGLPSIGQSGITPVSYQTATKTGSDVKSYASPETTGSKPGTVRSNQGKVGGSVDERGRYVVQKLMEKGWTKAQASGIAGNLEGESAFDPRAIGDSGKAYGIAQWRDERRTRFAEKYGKPIEQSTLDEQIEYLNWELQPGGPEKSAGAALKKATTPEEAARVVNVKFERSSQGKKGITSPIRINAANKYGGGSNEGQTMTAEYHPPVTDTKPDANTQAALNIGKSTPSKEYSDSAIMTTQPKDMVKDRPTSIASGQSRYAPEYANRVKGFSGSIPGTIPGTVSSGTATPSISVSEAPTPGTQPGIVSGPTTTPPISQPGLRLPDMVPKAPVGFPQIVSRPKPTEFGQGFSLDSVNDNLSDINDTLEESLDVQREILSTLKAMADNRESNNEGLPNEDQYRNSPLDYTKLPKPSIDLRVIKT